MTPDEFIALITKELKSAPNPEQAECLRRDQKNPTFIVAGPGSGKTRVLVLRALRHALVDKILPEQITITTFTRKAAKEIRSRLIQWGELLLAGARKHAIKTKNKNYEGYLDRVDLNRFVTGTLDSLCEEALDISRTPSEPRYTLLDEFASRTMLSRKGGLTAAKDTPFDTFLSLFTLDGEPPSTTGEAARSLKLIADRLIHDQVDEKIFSDKGDKGRHGALGVVQRYSQHMEETSQLDFARLEQMIWRRLKAGRNLGALTDARALLIDEYQDTNLLQEQIYFEIAKRHNAALTVVGDDDQSLYRFRGATIELFRDFAGRVQKTLGCGKIEPIYLKRNYRSSKDIVEFFNKFIVNDGDFSPAARVQPLKPQIVAEGAREAFPILGIFRDNLEDLADDVASLLFDVFRGKGRMIPGAGKITRATLGGDFGDAVLLSKSVNEFKRPFGGKPPTPRFPHHLRVALEGRQVRVFNPRGRPLRDIDAVQQLLGLVLETIDPSTNADPGGAIAPGMSLTMEAKRVFLDWRGAASALVAKNPKALGGTNLKTKLSEMRMLCKPGATAPREWPLLDAVYAYVPYIHALSDDPEHQIYLEAVSRAAAQMTSFSTFRGTILRSQQNTRSVEAGLRDMLAPLAEGYIDVDEDLLHDLPRSCFTMMTIHQSKGLEFPMVLVDVSSDFSMDHPKNKFKRFPVSPSGTTSMEDALATFTQIGPLRLKRTALQRSIEDIIREHYVAYSRPQSVLVLIGHLKAIASNTKTKHLGHFWRSDGTWAWTDGMPRKKPPPIPPNLPFVQI